MAGLSLHNLHISDESSKSGNTVDKWFENITRHLKEAGTYEDTLKQFHECKANKDRIQFVNELDIVHKTLNTEKLYKGKSEDEAVMLRNQGNLLFQKKQFQGALSLYSKSVLVAPIQNMEMTEESNAKENHESSAKTLPLALALANRSAVLYHLKHYELCLKDTVAALKYGYPKSLHFKLYDRQGKCYLKLKWKQEAIDAIEKATQLARESELKDDKLTPILQGLAKDRALCSELKDSERMKCRTMKECNSFHDKLPVLAGEAHETIPCASDAIYVEESEERGRGVYAAKNIDIGDIIVIEKPYTSTVLQPFENLICHHCCNRVISPLACPQCSGVCYCSEECQNDSWKSYHSVECHYLDRIQQAKVGLGHLSLRMVLKAGYDFLQEYKPKAESSETTVGSGYDEDGIYRSNSYHAVYNLVGHSEKRNARDLFKRSITALFLVTCIKDSNFFKSEKSDKDALNYIGGHILRHIQMCPCNAHEVSELELNKKQIASSETKEIGSAIYAVLSLFNHSCDPDVVRHSYGDICVVRAIKQVPKGQEIFDNYGAVYAVSNVNERREKLSPQYHFECRCQPCREIWPMYYDIPVDIPSYRCTKCRRNLNVMEEVPTNMVQCGHCKHVNDVIKIIVRLEKSDQMYSQALEKFLQGSMRQDQALPILNKHLQVMSELLCLPWQDFNNCQEAAKQCYAMQGNCYTV